MPNSKRLTLSAKGHQRVRRGNSDDAQVMRGILLSAAYDLFRVGGLDAITIRDVALRAKVSVMTPYRYFRNKADLLAGLWGSVVGELVAQQKQAVQRYRTPRERLRANIEAYLLFWETHPEHYQLVYMPPLTHTGEARAMVEGAPARSEVWDLSNQLTLEFAQSIGGDPARVETASQLRHFMVLGFLHTALVNGRPAELSAQLRPIVVEQAIGACERHLLQTAEASATAGSALRKRA